MRSRSKYKIETKPKVKVRPRFQRGAGRWMLVTCPNGKIIHQLSYGNMTDGQKALKGKPQYCGCAECTRE